MTSNIKSAEEFFKSNNIQDMNNEDDIFIHGIRYKDNKYLQETVKSFFDEGVRLSTSNTAYGASILATIALQEKDLSLKTEIPRYSFAGGVWNVILKIPRMLEGIYLGNCQPKYGNSGNQSAKNCILDHFNFDNIPREFIVGISVVTDTSDPQNNCVYIQNPYYYDHEQFKEVNTKTLLEKLKEKIINNSTLRDLTNDKIINDETIQFHQYLGDNDTVYLYQQKNEYLRHKLEKALDDLISGKYQSSNNDSYSNEDDYEDNYSLSNQNDKNEEFEDKHSLTSDDISVDKHSLINEDVNEDDEEYSLTI